MRNLFLSLTFMVALLLPQSLWAQTATVVGTKLTINTNFAGQVYAAVGALNLTPEQKAAITEIELIGKFNENDLNAIKGDAEGNSDGDFTGVTKVDMTNAQFVNTSAKLYHAGQIPSNASVGDNALVGGILYQLRLDNSKKKWKKCDEEPVSGSITLYSTEGDMTGAIGSAVEGTYAKVPSAYQYCLLTDNSHWEFLGSGASGIYPEKEWTISPYNSNYTENLDASESVIEIVRYYIFTNDGGSYHWAESNQATWDACTKTKWIAGEPPINDDTIETCLSNTVGNYDWYGFMFSIATYYRKVTAKNWSDPTYEAPDTYVNGNFDVTERENHKDSYSDGQWVRMYSGYNYFIAQSEADAYYWSETDYSDGTSSQDAQVAINVSNFKALETYKKAANVDKYALVGAQAMTYNGSEWVPGVTDVNYYSYMKFTYWQETITTAITSKYANETISGDIFQNCKKLTYVDYKAGNVTGFIDHKIASGYNTSDNTTLVGTGLSVKIGKNVTMISATAFKECDVLTSLEFDMDYESSNPDMLTGVTYPLDLDINEGAFLQCYNLSGVIFPNRVKSIGNTAFKQAGNNVDEFKVEFERRKVDNGASIEYDVNLTLGADAFGYCSKLKTISLPIRLVEMGNSVFENSGLEHFEIREDIEDSRLTVIPTNAFLASHLQEVVIPRSVTEIKGGAFMNCPSIRTVTFQESKQNPQPTLRIRSGAFSGGNEDDQTLNDVYVNIDPAKRLIICEYNAFSFTSLVAQTSVDNNKIARLHFSEEYWDYYAGDWKKGLAFNQGNLNAIKGGYTDATNHPEYKGKYNGDIANLETTGDYAGKYRGDLTSDDEYTPANGWQQFARTSTGIDIDIHKDKGAMRTYSTKKPVIVPTYASDDDANGIKAGDPMFQIYRISYFNDGTKTYPVGTPTATGNEVVTTYEKSSVTYQYVPANSGFIMTTKKSSNGYLVYMVDADAEQATMTYPYNPTSAGGANDNLLYPTCLDEQYGGPTQYYTQCKVPTLVDNGASVMLYPTIPCPYNAKGKTYEKGKLQYRLFGLSSTAEGKFNRFAVEATMTRDKAYLKLTPELFSLENEGQNVTGSENVDVPSSAPIMLALMDSDGETTDIRMIDPETLTEIDNSYYTLQGVKLNARPTQKGIYIHYGKKIVIK